MSASNATSHLEPDSSEESSHSKAPAPIGPSASWIFVALLTAALTGISATQSIAQYQELKSGWSWDLAYYNQWFWALTQGDQVLTIRPISAYGTEGPSIWKMNYLAPVRFILVPIYALAPSPLTLVVIQNIVFWWVIPAAFTLMRSETRSNVAAIAATALVPLTPLFWPLVWNDFRELQLAAPFVLWAVQGVRSRSLPIAAIGIAGMLACRQEYAIMVATFAFMPPRQPESLTVTLRWRRALVLTGLLWMVIGFFGYLRIMSGRGAVNGFIDQFLGDKAPFHQALETSLETLVFGVGAWAIFACLAPRIAILAFPWIWGPCSGQWAMRMLSKSEWHAVRYMMPMTALMLAAGLIGFAQFANWLLARRLGNATIVMVGIAAGLFSSIGLSDVRSRLTYVPTPINRDEAAEVWSWISQVSPDDAVLVDYDVSAPLSSRRLIFGLEMNENLPKGFPDLGPEFRWVFMRNTNRFYKPLLEKEFDVVYRGHYMTVARLRE